jgi:hypothetical protein
MFGITGMRERTVIVCPPIKAAVMHTTPVSTSLRMSSRLVATTYAGGAIRAAMSPRHRIRISHCCLPPCGGALWQPGARRGRPDLQPPLSLRSHVNVDKRASVCELLRVVLSQVGHQRIFSVRPGTGQTAVDGGCQVVKSETRGASAAASVRGEGAGVSCWSEWSYAGHHSAATLRPVGIRCSLFPHVVTRPRVIPCCSSGWRQFCRSGDCFASCCTAVVHRPCLLRLVGHGPMVPIIAEPLARTWSRSV